MKQLKVKNLKLINQAELARELGYTPAYVCMILKGKRNNPTAMKRIEKIIQKYYKLD